MPVSWLPKMAKKLGVSPARAEHLWKKMQKVIVGAKLRGGGTVGPNPENWGEEEWAFFVGAWKRSMGAKEGQRVTPLTASQMIEAVATGQDPRHVVHDAYMEALEVQMDQRALGE